MKRFINIYKIKCTPEELFIALTNSFSIELWTGYPARYTLEKGTEFELWDGDICGRTLDYKENEFLIQEWYFGDQEEQSIVTMKMKASGEHTKIELEHINIPDEVFEDIRTGWNEYYFGNLIKYFK